jgi:hypothetical protein
MRPTIAVSAPAAAIELGIGSVSVMAHKITVRSTQIKPRSLDADRMGDLDNNSSGIAP